MTVTLAMEIVVKGKEDASKIFDNIKRSAGDAQVSLKKVTQETDGNKLAFTELNSALALAKQAFSAVVSVVKLTVGAYMESEDSLNRMAASLKMSGSYTDEAMESMVKFSETMQEFTRFEDDAVLSLMSMGKAAGYSNETVKAMTLAAANLSVVTKKDLGTSFDALLMSLNGQTRSLKQMMPELKSMSDEAIRGGAAINLINEKFKDAAVNEQSLSNSSEKLRNSFGNMLESIGKVIAESINLRETFDGLASLFTRLGRAIDSVDFRKLADGLREGLPFIISSTLALGSLFAIFSNLSVLMTGGTIAMGLSKITFGLRAAWIAAAPFLLIAAKILLIVAAIVALAAAIDQLVRNFSRLGDAWGLVWNLMQQVSLRAMAMIYDKLAEIAWMFGANAETWKEKSRQMIRDADELKASFKVSKEELTTNWDTGFVGKIIGAFKGMGDSAKEGGNKAALGGNKAKVALTGISEAAKKAAEELKKFLDELVNFNKETAQMANANELIGKNEVKQAAIKYRQSLEGLNEMIAKGKTFNRQKEIEEAISKRIFELGKTYTKDTTEGYTKLTEEGKKYFDQLSDISNMMAEGAYSDADRLLFSAYEKAREVNSIIGDAMDFSEKNPDITLDLDLPNLMDQVNAFVVKAERDAKELRLKAQVEPYVDAINAATAGSRQTLAYVFSQWGAIGQVIGGIIGFFDRPPTEFLTGIRELFNSIITDMTKNILTNIPIFVRELFRAVSGLIHLLFSDANKSAPKFIFSLIKALGDGIGQMLKDIVMTVLTHSLGANMKALGKGIRDAWKEIFLGQKAAQEATENATKTTTVVTKYKKISDSAAGREEFRVREYEASETTTTTWEQKVKEVTNAQEESLGTSILGLWKDFIADIREAFDWFKRAIIEITKEVTYGIIYAISSALFGVVAILAAIITATVVGPIMAIITLLTGGGIQKAIGQPLEMGRAAGNYIWSRQKKFTNWVDESMSAQEQKVASATTTPEPQKFFDLSSEQVMSLTSETAMEASPIASILGEGLGEGLLGGLQEATGTSMLYNLGTDMWNGFWDKTGQATTWALELGGKIWQGFWSWSERLTTWFQELGGKIWSGFWNFNIEAMIWARNLGARLWNGFWELVGMADSWAAQTGLKLWNGFWNMAIGITTWASNAGLALWNGFWDKLVAAGEWFKNAGSAIWGGVTSAITVAWEWIKSIGGAIWTGFTNSIIAGWEWIKSVGGAIYNGFTKAITVAWDWIKSIGGAIWTGVSSGATTAWKWVGSIGKQIWTGLESAIVASWNFFRDIGKQIWSGVSPSGGGGSGGTLGRVATGVATGGLSEVYRAIFHNGGLVEPLRFADGGGVPGFGFTDSVPAMLTPGEHVLTQSQAASMRQGQLGGTTVVLNISPGADVSESAIRRYLVPAVIDAIDRQSINGRRFVNQRGIY